MKKILLVTDGLVHPPLSARIALHKTLAESEVFEFQHVRSMEKLPNNPSDFSALVIYIHHKKISDGALETLDGFVANGGGILGVHTATASFKQQMHYFEILGGRFTGHGPVEPFEVEPVSESTIFAGIPAFTVKDELYIHEFQSEIDVHFTAKHEGQNIPVVWTRQYGKGRVCYAVPGHTTASMRNASYRKILQRGLTWVCGR
jgi:type 1 glutamine amidotransferase